MSSQNKIEDPADMMVDDSKVVPRHPGPFIKSEVIEALGLNVSSAAKRMGINRPNFHEVLEGRSSVSSDLAYRLEALTGVDADLVIAMQRAFDRAAEQARRAHFKTIIDRVELPAEKVAKPAKKRA